MSIEQRCHNKINTSMRWNIEEQHDIEYVRENHSGAVMSRTMTLVDRLYMWRY